MKVKMKKYNCKSMKKRINNNRLKKMKSSNNITNHLGQLQISHRNHINFLLDLNLTLCKVKEWKVGKNKNVKKHKRKMLWSTKRIKHKQLDFLKLQLVLNKVGLVHL